MPPIVLAIDTAASLSVMIEHIFQAYARSPAIVDLFVDTEGDCLTGALSLVQIFVESIDTVYLVDALTLGLRHDVERHLRVTHNPQSRLRHHRRLPRAVEELRHPRRRTRRRPPPSHRSLRLQAQGWRKETFGLRAETHQGRYE